jgi:hypothetical protein
MERTTLRAVRQAEDAYRVAVQPADARVDRDRAYRRAEVEELARALDADLRWVGEPTDTRRLEIDPGARVAGNTDPWGGMLPADDDS